MHPSPLGVGDKMDCTGRSCEKVRTESKPSQRVTKEYSSVSLLLLADELNHTGTPVPQEPISGAQCGL